MNEPTACPQLVGPKTLESRPESPTKLLLGSLDEVLQTIREKNRGIANATSIVRNLDTPVVDPEEITCPDIELHSMIVMLINLGCQISAEQTDILNSLEL